MQKAEGLLLNEAAILPSLFPEMRKLLFLLIFVPLLNYAQDYGTGTIKGVVVDSSDNAALSGAGVLLKDSGKGTISGPSGEFILNNVEAGEHLLELSFIGYHTWRKKLTIHPSKTLQLEIRLQKIAYEIEEININAAAGQDIRQKSYRIELLQKEQLEISPSQNVSEVLDFVAGVNVNNTTGIFSDKTTVSMRGLSGDEQSRVLVLLDGIPLNKSDGGTVNWNQINKDEISNIKVHKGPGKAMYGSGAMGGVIEITGKKPLQGLHGNFSAAYGTYNTLRATSSLSARYDFKKESWLSWALSGFGTVSDGYITEAEQFYESEDSILVPTSVKEYNFSGKLDYQMNRQNRLRLKLSYFDDKRGNGVQVFDDFGSYSEHDTWSSVADFSRRTDEKKTDLRFYFLHENYHRLYEYMNEGEYKLYDVDSKRQDIGTDLRLTYFEKGIHSLTAGINLRHGSVDAVDTYFTSTDIISNGGNLAGGAFYLQDDISLYAGILTMTAGLRYDAAVFYDASFGIDYPSYSIQFMSGFEENLSRDKIWGAFCPNISLNYLIGNQNRLYLSAGRGFRSPTLDDLTRTGKKRGSFKVANPDLGPELLDNYEAGIDWQFGKNISTGLSGFFSVGHDFMYYISTGDSVNMGYKIVPILRKENISKVFIYGLEVNAEYRLQDFLFVFTSFTMNYSEIKKHLMNDPSVDVALQGKHLTDVPDYKFSGGISAKVKNYALNFSFKHIGQRWINDQNIIDDEYLFTDRYPAYTIYNMSISAGLFKSFEAVLAVENIFDKIYIDNSARQNPGRMLWLKLAYSF